MPERSEGPGEELERSCTVAAGARCATRRERDGSGGSPHRPETRSKPDGFTATTRGRAPRDFNESRGESSPRSGASQRRQAPARGSGRAAQQSSRREDERPARTRQRPVWHAGQTRHAQHRWLRRPCSFRQPRSPRQNAKHHARAVVIQPRMRMRVHPGRGLVDGRPRTVAADCSPGLACTLKLPDHAVIELGTRAQIQQLSV